MKPLVKISLLVIIILLTGCGTAINITTNKDPNYTKEIKKVIFVSQLNTKYSDFNKCLATAIQEEFKNNNINCKCLIDDGITLKNDYNKIIEDFKPDVLLTVIQVEETTNGSKSYTFFSTTEVKVILNATVTDVLLKKPIWRGKIDFDCTDSGLPGVSQAIILAKDIVKKMKEDKLLK